MMINIPVNIMRKNKKKRKWAAYSNCCHNKTYQEHNNHDSDVDDDSDENEW